jgi:hypothetical protein
VLAIGPLFLCQRRQLLAETPVKAKQQNQNRTLSRQARSPDNHPDGEKIYPHCLSLRLSSEQYRRLRRFVRSFEDQTGQLRMQQAVLKAALEEYFDRNAGSRPRRILEVIDVYAQPESKNPDSGRSHIVSLRLTREQYRQLRLLVLVVEEQTGRRLTHQLILQSVLAKYLARHWPAGR